MTPPDTLRLNEFGFFEVKDKPTPEALRDYYAQRYYQENLTTYQTEYSAEELEHIEGKLRLRHHVAEQLRPANAATSYNAADAPSPDAPSPGAALSATG